MATVNAIPCLLLGVHHGWQPVILSVCYVACINFAISAKRHHTAYALLPTLGAIKAYSEHLARLFCPTQYAPSGICAPASGTPLVSFRTKNKKNCF